MIKLIKSSFFKEKEIKQKLCDFINRAESLSMGAECKKFEENFAKKQGRKYAIFVNSGSSANLILLQSLLNLGFLRRGDKVGVSALTWSTNVMPVIQLGMVPVAIDCEVSTLNVSPATAIPELQNVRALFLTNVLGLADDIKKLRQLCADKNILFLEDNCESLGSKTSGKFLGNFGLASTFSFFVGHHFSTIEGGMICTDDENLYHMLTLVRTHGWDRHLPAKKQKYLREQHNVDPFFGKFTFYDLAYNVRPTEISGFLGNLQLELWEEIVAKREKNFRSFCKAREGNEDIFPLDTAHMETVSNFAMPLVFKNRAIFASYRKKFDDAEVEIRPIIAGSVLNQPFWKKYVGVNSACPNANIVHAQGLYFPNNPELTDGEVEMLSSLIRSPGENC